MRCLFREYHGKKGGGHFNAGMSVFILVIADQSITLIKLKYAI